MFATEDGITTVSAEYEWVFLRQTLLAPFSNSPDKVNDNPDISISGLWLKYGFSRPCG